MNLGTYVVQLVAVSPNLSQVGYEYRLLIS